MKISALFFSIQPVLLNVHIAHLAAIENFSQLPEPISKEYNFIHYIISPQVELVSIIQSISEYPKVLGFLLQDDSFSYKQEVLKKFDPFKDNPVVDLFNQLCLRPGKMNFSAPSNVMLYADEHLDLRSDLQADDFVFSRACGMDTLLLFFKLVKDFASASSFNDFYKNHTDYYQQLLSNTISILDTVNYITELETFYGMRQKSYNIVLVSLYSHVGFGNSIVDLYGRREIFDTMGPQKTEHNIPSFGDNRYFKYLTRHEFSHPFINPVTEKYWDLINVYANNYESIPEQAKQNVCGDWQECINEFVIRAITVHIAFRESKEIGIQVFEKEKSNGVKYLEPLLEALRVYSDNRSQFPTFEFYYPQILEIFKKS